MFEFIGQDSAVPADAAVSAEELRSQLSLCDGEESDVLLLGLIRFAQGAVEARTQRLLSPRPIRLAYRGSGTAVDLHACPVNSVSSVTADGATVSGAQLCAFGIRPRLTLPAAVSGELVIAAECGYMPEKLPPELKMLVLELAADLYEHRESQSETALTENRTFRMVCDLYTVYEV
ncbi:MAG: hypothetical protein HPZ91_19135 [Lentisphaeria bacterium]|nr:hypothetical protein [Lentisphaeria bacterium]